MLDILRVMRLVNNFSHVDMPDQVRQVLMSVGILQHCSVPADKEQRCIRPGKIYPVVAGFLVAQSAPRRETSSMHRCHCIKPLTLRHIQELDADDAASTKRR